MSVDITRAPCLTVLKAVLLSPHLARLCTIGPRDMQGEQSIDKRLGWSKGGSQILRSNVDADWITHQWDGNVFMGVTSSHQ